MIDETRIERALRQGPPYRTRFVAQPLPLGKAGVGVRRASSTRRLGFGLVLLSLLLVGALAALAAAGLFRPQPRPASELTPVLELSDGSTGVLRTTHVGIIDTGQPASILGTLPQNAVLLRWSPDGSHLAYLVEVPAAPHGVAASAMYVANGDGGDPKKVALPRAASWYGVPGWIYGPRWSPDGTMVAIRWDTETCSGPPGCLPANGTDVFDASGRQVLVLSTTKGMGQIPMWSADSQRIGWTSGSCVGTSCFVDEFHHQAVRGSATVTTVKLPQWSDVTWSTTGRLLVVAYTAQFASVQRVYSVALDGTDEQPIAWDDPTATPMWSPDGRWLAAVSKSGGPLTIRNAQTGSDATVVIPTGLAPAMWSPDSQHLVLYGGDGPAYTLYTVNVDGSGFRSLGNAQDVTWRPAG